MDKTLIIKKLPNKLELTNDWNDSIWADLEAHKLSEWMGDKPRHFPMISFKIGYQDDALVVIFHADDYFVKALSTETHGAVWEDSCVEFFFAPNPANPTHYFNFEINCLGNFLYRFQTDCDENLTFLPAEFCEKVTTKATFSAPIVEEIAQPTEWSVAFRLPLAELAQFTEIEPPAPGVKWTGNFYKCADGCSHPHWLTWSKMDHPTPKFHIPTQFGQLIFE